VGRDSRRKELAKRLVAALTSSPSKDRFLAAGFEWEADRD
jgi:hypothetical protein